ncbi:hypothetical protein BWD121_014060 [Bartonella sp. WD12.1]|nr:hypothetical protein BWD121_014060 [Bartonella sp. WD12.1]
MHDLRICNILKPFISVKHIFMVTANAADLA